MWREYFPKVIVPSLIKRTDRRERMTEQLNAYNIDFEFFDAIESTNGAEGLVMTMKQMFKECIEQGWERVLVLEDDAEMLVQPIGFEEIMDRCTEDLKFVHWDIFALGLQHPKCFTHWLTPNILPVEIGFSTHASAYNTTAMEFIISAHIGEPIDNYLVHAFQKYNTTVCSYPMLCTQFADYSDIGKDFCNWQPFLLPLFERNVRPILANRFNNT